MSRRAKATLISLSLFAFEAPSAGQDLDAMVTRMAAAKGSPPGSADRGSCDFETVEESCYSGSPRESSPE